MASEDELGPTGRFPKGKLSVDDKGELAVGLAIDEKKGTIIMDFGVPIKWIGMSPEEAMVLADALINLAHTLNELKGKENNGA